MAKERYDQLDADTHFRQAIGAIIETRYDVMMNHLEGTLAGRDPEELHQMRVWSRRLRAAMDVAGDCFPARYSYYHKTIKQLTDALGDVRDCDVLRDALAAYRNGRPKEDRAAVNLLLQDLRARRELARAEMLTFFERLEHERFDVRFRGFMAEHTVG